MDRQQSIKESIGCFIPVSMDVPAWCSKQGVGQVLAADEDSRGTVYAYSGQSRRIQPSPEPIKDRLSVPGLSERLHLVVAGDHGVIVEGDLLGMRFAAQLFSQRGGEFSTAPNGLDQKAASLSDELLDRLDLCVIQLDRIYAAKPCKGTRVFMQLFQRDLDRLQADACSGQVLGQQ